MRPMDALLRRVMVELVRPMEPRSVIRHISTPNSLHVYEFARCHVGITPVKYLSHLIPSSSFSLLVFPTYLSWVA